MRHMVISFVIHLMSYIYVYVLNINKIYIYIEMYSYLWWSFIFYLLQNKKAPKKSSKKAKN